MKLAIIAAASVLLASCQLPLAPDSNPLNLSPLSYSITGIAVRTTAPLILAPVPAAGPGPVPTGVTLPPFQPILGPFPTGPIGIEE